MIIEIPDKNIELEFPDDMSHDEISSIIQRDIYGESEQPKFSVGRLGYQVYSNIAQGISDIISAQQYGERGRDIEQSEKMISQGLPSEVLGSEQQFIGEELARAAIAKGAPSDRAVPIAKYLTQDEIDQIRLSARKQKSAGFVESAGRLKESLPKPLEGAPGGIGGIVEQAAGGMARFAPSMAATAISGPAGFATTFTQIYGAEREKYDKQGVDDERAETAALMSALGQAPVEFLGNIVQIGALGEIAKSIKRPGMKRLATFAGAIIKSSISEGIEEYIQKYPELIADIYASNPDADATKLAEKTLRTITSLEFQKQAGVEAGIGAVGGAMLAGGGGIISEGVGLTQKKEGGNLNDEQINQIVSAANEDLKNGAITPDELQSTIQKYRDVIDINQADIDTIISRISTPEEQVNVVEQEQVPNAAFEFPQQTEQEQADIEREIMHQRSRGPDVLQALRERNQREIQQTKSDKEAALSEFRENLKRRISGEIPGAEVDIVRQESELSRLKSKFEDEKNAREIREDEGQVQEGGIERQGGKTEGRENLQQPEKERAETSYEEKPLEYESKKSEISKGEAVKGEMVQEVPSAEIQKISIPEFKTTNEAVAFGETATPEQITELNRLEKQARDREAELKAAKDFSEERTNNVYMAQLYRESLEASRGEHPSQRDKRTPTETLISASQNVKNKSQKKEFAHDYSSTQVNLPESEANDIRKYASNIPDNEIYSEPNDDSYGREDSPHITIRYGMETIDPDEIAPAFYGIGPIKVKMGKVSIFESDKYDVVKVDIESADLKKANKMVGDTVDLPGETFKDYMPHATIAYVKKGEGKKYIGDKTFEGKEVAIDEVVLSGRDGKMSPIKLDGESGSKQPEKIERRKVVAGPGGAVGFEGKLEEGKKERRIGPQEIRSTEKAESVNGRTKEVDDAIKRVKNSIKSERGSWSFEQSEHPITKDLITIGRHIYSTGATKFKDFSNRLRSTIGESFERIKNDIRNLYDNVKRTISNERGEVVIREEKFSEKPIDPKAEKIIKKLRGLYTKTGKISPAKTKKAIEKYESLTNDLREARDDIYKKQKALEKHIKSNIPKSEQYRLLSQIKKMASVAKKETREKRYNEAIEAINAVHEKSEKTKLIEKIKAELKKKRPKKTQRGIISNLRMDVKANKLISMARKYIEINRDDGIYEISEMMNKFDMENREPTPSELEKISMIQSFSGINNKTIDELKSSLETIKDIIKTGRASWMNDESARKERMNKLRDTAYEEFTGGKGLKTTEEIDREKSRKTWLSNAREALRSFDDLHQNFEFLLDKLSRFHKKTETLGGETTEYFTDLVHAATHTESSGVSKQINIVNNKLVEIFGSKNLAKTLNKNTKIKEKTGVYRYKDGKKIEKPLSQNMAYKLWQLFQQPSLIDELEKHGYTKDTLKQLEKFIDPKVLRWAEWQVNEFYPQYRDGINDIYKKLFYVDMGEIEGYSPVARIYANQKQDEVLLGEGGHYSSVIAGSVKSRVKTPRDFNILDGDSVLMKHISEMEHFKAWGIPMRELRSVLNSEKIQEAIVQYHGRTANNVIKQFMDHFASGGIDRVNTLGTLDKLRSNFTKSAIGANPVVFLKQLASIPAYSMDIPASSFNAGVASFFKNPIKAYKTLMKSEMMKSRYGVGFERDIKLALQRSTAKRLAGKKSITDALMITTKLGDKAAIVVGGWASYRYNYKQAKKRGLSDSKAHNFAIREFEKSTERSQQAGNVKDLAHIQRLGSLGKLFTMFMTSPSSYYRSLSAGVRNFKAGRGSKYSNVKRIVVAHFVLPMLFQFIASGFKWEKEKQLRAAVVGPLNGLFIAREAIEGFMTALLEGQAYWSLGVTPPLSTLQSVSRSGKKINRAFLDGIDEDQFWSIMSDLIGIAGTLKGVPVKTLKRTATGIGEVYRGETDKPVRRIIGFKDKEE